MERIMNSLNDYGLGSISPTPGPLPASDICRGVCRHLTDLGYSVLTEFRLISNRRVDVIGLNKGGNFIVVEVKSSVPDFKADEKWPDYRSFADKLYFAVANGFPIQLMPPTCGTIIADAYNAVIFQDSPQIKMNGARRRTQILRFAQTAADRLHRTRDPRI